MSKFYSVVKFIFAPVVKLAFNVKVINKEGFPLDQTVIVASNHTSNWDAVLLGAVCKKQLYFMAKAELFKFKPLGYIIKKLGAFPVNRGRRDNNATKSVYETIEKGRTLAIFPQGTRMPRKEDASDAKSGVALFAATSDTAVLPVYVHNKKGRVRIFSRNTIVFGEVIPASEFKGENGTVLEYREKAEGLMKTIFSLKERITKKK